MRKITLVLLLIMLLTLSIQPAFAAEQSEVEYLEDGGYIITTIEETFDDGPDLLTRASTATTKSKKSAYYNSAGKVMWHVTVTGKFTYNGSSASCIKATHVTASNASSWKVSGAKSWKSGSKAKASATGKQYQNGQVVKSVPKTVTLTCSPNGKFS